MVETEIERLNEELQPRKDRDDPLQSTNIKDKKDLGMCHDITWYGFKRIQTHDLVSHGLKL